MKEQTVFFHKINQALNKYLAEYEKVGIYPKHFESMTEYAEDYNKEISEEI